MIITRKQDIYDGVYSVTIQFKEFGRKDLTAKEEKEIIENFGAKIEYKNIDFKGNFKVEDGKVAKSDSTSDDEVVLDLNNIEIPLDEKLDIVYNVKASLLSDSLLGTHLNTKEKVAYAMCTLFGDKIEEEINKVILDAIEKTGDFENEEEKTL